MKFILITLVLIWCLMPVSGDFTVFKNPFNKLFKSSNATQFDISASMQRSSLISDKGNEFSAASNFFRNSLFRNKFVVQLQDMLSRKSIDEQSAIVNIDDVDYYSENHPEQGVSNAVHFDSFLKKMNESKIIEQPFLLHADSTDYDDDDDDEEGEEEEEDDDEFSNRLQKNVNLFNQTTKDLNDQTIHLNKSFSDSTSENQKLDTAHRLNQSFITTYTYLGNQHSAESNIIPSIMSSKLLGNTMDSIENIFKKYKFLNLYHAPTINDTHHDRDLHQKENNKVILKANFIDYIGYANTEKSVVHGNMPPVQADIAFGNFRVHGNKTDEDRLGVAENVVNQEANSRIKDESN